MSTAGDLFFYFCATIAILCALATVTVRSPIRAAVGLLGHIVALAGIYLTLHAHFIAALQLIVYAGAVVVLFVFVIMLIGPTPIAPGNARGLVTRSLAAAIMGLFSSAVAFSLISYSPVRASIPVCPDGVTECGQFGGVQGLGTALFQQALVPFELVSMLLLVAIVGAVAVARGRSTAEAAEAKARHAEQAKAREAQSAHERALAAEVAAHEGH